MAFNPIQTGGTRKIEWLQNSSSFEHQSQRLIIILK